MTRHRAFLTALAMNALWINLSEVVRYFAFVMPMMRAAFPGVPDVAPMSLGIFLRWGLWDLMVILAATGGVWMALDLYGRARRTALLAGTAVWAAIFGVLWFGLLNMNLATPAILAVALPLAWVEMAVAALIVHRFHRGAPAGHPA